MRYFIRIFKQPDLWTSVEKGLNITNFPADPLRDLTTDDNDISIFEIENDNKLNEVIAGYSGAREGDIKNVHYIKLEPDLLKDFTVKQEDGITASTEANGLHYNIKELTAKKLVKLAFIIYKAIIKSPNAHKSSTEIFEFIKKSKTKGTLDEQRVKLNKALRTSLGISKST